jgi:hypothetical protein
MTEGFGTHAEIESIVEKSAAKNKRLTIGGHLEVQYTLVTDDADESGAKRFVIKFVNQTIYGKKSVIEELYSKIKNDPRHIITEEFIDEIPLDGDSEECVEAQNKINGGWGMCWRNRNSNRVDSRDNAFAVKAAIGHAVKDVLVQA